MLQIENIVWIVNSLHRQFGFKAKIHSIFTSLGSCCFLRSFSHNFLSWQFLEWHRTWVVFSHHLKFLYCSFSLRTLTMLRDIHNDCHCLWLWTSRFVRCWEKTYLWFRRYVQYRFDELLHCVMSICTLSPKIQFSWMRFRKVVKVNCRCWVRDRVNFRNLYAWTGKIGWWLRLGREWLNKI